jgi:hypothetical protein
LSSAPLQLSEAVNALADRIRSASGERRPGSRAGAGGTGGPDHRPCDHVDRWRELIALADRTEHTESRTYGVSITEHRAPRA